MADVFIEGYRAIPSPSGSASARARSRPATRAVVYARLTGWQCGRSRGPPGRHQLRRADRGAARHGPGRRGLARRSTCSVTTPVAGLVAAFGIVSAVLEARSSGRGAGDRRRDGRRGRTAHREDPGSVGRRPVRRRAGGPTT
ncbi:hypothetical protein HBB16_12565 [Pseudonocardia sp. MCCB 268]|nr:hypothetical protein [Pseudonocardia cytotoxica]